MYRQQLQARTGRQLHRRFRAHGAHVGESPAHAYFSELTVPRYRSRRKAGRTADWPVARTGILRGASSFTATRTQRRNENAPPILRLGGRWQNSRRAHTDSHRQFVLDTQNGADTSFQVPSDPPHPSLAAKALLMAATLAASLSSSRRRPRPTPCSFARASPVGPGQRLRGQK